jgi:predicted nucleotidyltransferase
MSKTALTLSAEEKRAYHPDTHVADEALIARWERAWRVARRAADLLRARFAATRVVTFGSLAHRAGFTAWSDVDLAVWGLASDAYYRAVAEVTGLSAEFEIDLVIPDDCHPGLRDVIEQEGIPL